MRRQNSLHGTHTVTQTHSCKAMEVAWPISFLAQTQSLTHMHAHHVHMQECKQSIPLPQRLHACTCKTHSGHRCNLTITRSTLLSSVFSSLVVLYQLFLALSLETDASSNGNCSLPHLRRKVPASEEHLLPLPSSSHMGWCSSLQPV